MKVELLSITPSAGRNIERAGRTAYKSEKNTTPTSYKSFIKMLINNGHESVLEHASASFRITGVSRAFSHQLVRHRLASYTQESQRYVKQHEFDYITPSSIHMNKAVKEAYDNAMEHLDNFYNFATNVHNIPKEDARYALPNSCETEVVMTCNFREWRFILKTRLHRHAQWEIREVMADILDILARECPSVFGDIADEYFDTPDERP